LKALAQLPGCGVALWTRGRDSGGREGYEFGARQDRVATEPRTCCRRVAERTRSHQLDSLLLITILSIESLQKTIVDMRAVCEAERRDGKRLGFVPTMGALHEGHLSLVRAAKAGCDWWQLRFLLNPTQFVAGEDLAKYPRRFEQDRELLQREGVAVLFAPSVEEMYPAGSGDRVTVDGLSDKLDGRSRPGHFRGVTTVVAKLFYILDPDVVFLGQKGRGAGSYHPAYGARPEIRVKIVECPIVREEDGLAMSSRNAYLDPQERKQALVLHRSLMRGEEAVGDWRMQPGKIGVADAKKLRKKNRCGSTTSRS